MSKFNVLFVNKTYIGVVPVPQPQEQQFVPVSFEAEVDFNGDQSSVRFDDQDHSLLWLSECLNGMAVVFSVIVDDPPFNVWQLIIADPARENIGEISADDIRRKVDEENRRLKLTR